MSNESQKANVLVVHNYYQIPGGEDIVVANEIKMLKEHGHKVILYSRNNSELKSMNKLLKLTIPFNMIFNFRTYSKLKQIIHEEQIEIIHVHNTINLVSPAVYYAAESCGVPVVQTVHNFRLLCPGATFYREGHICEECVEKGLICAVKHGCYRESKMQTLVCVISTKFHRMTGIYSKINYICLTEFNKEKLLGLKQINKSKVFVKPNFVEDNVKFVPVEKRITQFIFVGRLDKLKGIDFLLEAWKQMGRNAPKLIVCGIGPLETWCNEFVSKNNVNVELKGFISNSDVKNLIANCQALILPTQWFEGFPMTIVESYSVGTPVICSNIGNPGSLVKEGITGCKFEADSIDKLILAIYRIQRYPNIYETTLTEYKEKYTQAKNYKSLMNVYQEILE